jgi:hypothetical protein
MFVYLENQYLWRSNTLYANMKIFALLFVHSLATHVQLYANLSDTLVCMTISNLLGTNGRVNGGRKRLCFPKAYPVLENGELANVWKHVSACSLHANPPNPQMSL